MSALTTALPRAAWIDRFAGELGRRWPDIDPTAAAEHAIAEFNEAADLTPEEAAAIFCEGGAPPREEGAGE